MSTKLRVSVSDMQSPTLSLLTLEHACAATLACVAYPVVGYPTSVFLIGIFGVPRTWVNACIYCKEIGDMLAGIDEGRRQGWVRRFL